MKRTASCLLVPAFALCLASLDAQTHRGLVRGRVTDAMGRAVNGARVAATHQDTNEQRTVTSDDTGTFALAELPPGPYRFVIESGGHRMHVEELTLDVNQERRIDVRLQIGALTDRVEVMAPRADVRRNTALGTVIGNRQIVGLPLDGRNVLDLTLLAPGAVPAAEGSAGSVRGDFSFSVNGAREDFNGYLLDGADNVDPKLNTVSVTPPVDAIQEFEVLTSTADTTFGRQGGAHVNVITRSGSNDLRGTAWEFFRSGALDSPNHFAPENEPDPEYERHQYGASIGGPLVRDRAFFFADYEGTRVEEGITRIATVPTAEARALAAFLPAHPIGRAIAGLYPEPNRPGATGNVVSSPVQEDRIDSFDARLDHGIGESFDLMGRYSLADRRLYEPFSGPGFSALPGFGSDVARRGHNAVVSATQVVSSTLVNESRVGFNRVSSSVTPEAGVTNRSVGLPEPWTNPRDAGLSFITVTGFSPIGAEYNNPQQGTTNAIHVTDTLTWSRGRHLVKLGGDGRFVRQRAFRDVQARGALTFTGLLTGTPFTDLLFGLPTFTTIARLDNPQDLRTESYAAFVQDSIDVRADLTVSLGVRYEVTSAPVDAGDRATLYDPATGRLQAVGSGDLPRAGYDADTNNWAPRVGVAWAPGGGGTVLRASYGIHYNQSALAPSEGLYFNAPYFNLGVNVTSASAPLFVHDPFAQTGFFPQSGTAFQRDLRTPYLHQFNVNVQRPLGSSRLLEAAYVGSRGRNLIAGRDLNQPAASPAPLNLRPNPLFGDITFIESRARSRYDSLQLRFEQRLDRGFTMLAAYTLAKSEDDASAFFTSGGDPNFPQDSHNVAAEWGRSNFDVRHRLSAGVSQELPWEMQVSGVVTLQSGRPFTVALLPETDNSNTGRTVLGFGANDRPNVTGDPSLSDPAADRWFDTGAFTLPAFGSFGNAGRNILDGPGYVNVNLALMKHVTVGGSRRLQLRAEVFNLFNRANFGLPDNFFGSPTFGQVLTADAPRRVQLGARLLF
ncbi:MAG: TonB-dependent receptor domain-containing protein [Vicinamibacterales bacterium]